ncbi:MAG: hypothetical protein R8M38_01155 [Mariprofundaceae bacterium]
MLLSGYMRCFIIAAVSTAFWGGNAFAAYSKEGIDYISKSIQETCKQQTVKGSESTASGEVGVDEGRGVEGRGVGTCFAHFYLADNAKWSAII